MVMMYIFNVWIFKNTLRKAFDKKQKQIKREKIIKLQKIIKQYKPHTKIKTNQSY